MAEPSGNDLSGLLPGRTIALQSKQRRNPDSSQDGDPGWRTHKNCIRDNQAVHHKCLVCSRQAELPRCSRALEASALRGASVWSALHIVTLTATTPTPTLHTSSRKRILASELTWARSECGEAEARTNRRTLWDFYNVDCHLLAYRWKRVLAPTAESGGKNPSYPQARARIRWSPDQTEEKTMSATKTQRGAIL